MTRIFWVTCPRCRERFYCHHQDLRHTTWKLRCPYCELEFAQEEALEIHE
jgi:predicted Zn finger-like uncharacterized protein